jgi:hypothetical protein
VTRVLGLLAADGSANPLVPAGAELLFGLLLLIPALLFLGALVSILASRRYTGGGKLLWVVVVFCLPLLGPLGWFLGGRTAQIRTAQE